LLEADGGERIDAVAMVQGDEPLVAPETVQRSLAARDFSGGWVCQGICSTTVAIR
jgi:CTP:molybdopterin cytidylyltransferase MocA